MTNSTRLNKIKLSKHTTIEQYGVLRKNKNTKEIAGFIKERFTERYIAPFRNNEQKHGFAMMAVACLMIETLQSFHEGLKNTKGSSKKIFENFFIRHRDFGLSTDDAIDDFYDDIRCGILHQAETRNGWIIRRYGPLYDSTNKCINATEFLKEVENSLNTYCNELQTENWDAPIWENCIKKIDNIVTNCQSTV